jgi:fibronectin-binding autotransporter adhesin
VAVAAGAATIDNNGNALTISGVISGAAGAVNFTGANTTTLTAANTYGGGTTISGGTLSVSADNNLGAAAGGLTFNGGTLLTTAGFTSARTVTVAAGGGTIDTQANTLTLSGPVTFTGNLTKLGTGGTLVFTGANSGAGSLLVNQGTVSVGNGGTMGTLGNGGIVSLALGTNLIFNRSNALTITNAISGAGSVAQAGTGTTTLNSAGPNSFSGGLTIGNGTLVAAANEQLGTGAVVVNAPGTLVVNAGTGQTIASLTTSGAGATVNNSGTITSATAVQNFGTFNNVVAAAVLNGGINNLATGVISNAGTINGGVVNAGTLASTNTITGGLFNSNAANLAGTMSGAVTNVAGGTVTVTATLAGNSTFDNAGALNVTGGNYTGLTTLTNTGTITVAANQTLAAITVNNNAGSLAVGANATLSNVILNNVAAITVATNGNLTSTGTVTNLAGGSINFNGPAGTATLTSGGAIINDGQIALASGNLTVAGSVTNQGAGTIAVNGGNVTGVGAFTNTSAANPGLSIAATRSFSAASVTNGLGSTIANAGTLTSAAVVQNSGTLNNLTAASIINGGVNNLANGQTTNAGTINNGVTNSGSFSTSGFVNGGVNNLANGQTTNAGTINGGVTNNGSFSTSGIVNGNLSNTGSVSASGQVNGNISNSAGVFAVVGPLTGTGVFTNAGLAQLQVTGGNFSGLTTVTNTSTAANGITIAAGRTLSFTSLTNVAGSTILNSGTLASGTISNAGTLSSNAATSVLSGTLANAGTFNGAGTLNSSFVNNLGTFNVAGNLGGATGLFVNIGTVNLAGGNFNGITTFNNAGSLNVTGARTIGATTFNNLATGRIAMQNGNTADSLTVAGAYSGTAGSVLAVDANFSATPVADRLNITGGASGITLVRLNNIVGDAKTFFNPPLVVVSGATGGNFAADLADPATAAALARKGILSYSFQSLGGGNFGVVSNINASSAAGAAAQISSVLTSMNAGFFQNASPFTSGATEAGANKWSGGPWIRSSAGNFTADSKSSAAGFSQDSRVSANYAGVQLGVDTGLFDIGGSGVSAILGVTGGQVNAEARDKKATLSKGTFKVPFVGLYGVVSGYGFTGDLQVRRDQFNSAITNDLAELRDQPLHARGLSFSGSLAYKIDIGSWFAEPSFGLNYSRVKVNPLNVSPGIVTFRDIKSLIGRAGLRVGTTLEVNEKLVIQPFAIASIWREFEGSSLADFSVAPGVPISTTRIGTYGQFGLGVAGQLVESNLLGFFRADVRTGKSVSGWAVNAGVRKQF